MAIDTQNTVNAGTRQLIGLTHQLVQVHEDLRGSSDWFRGVRDTAADAFREAEGELQALLEACCSDILLSIGSPAIPAGQCRSPGIAQTCPTNGAASRAGAEKRLRPLPNAHARVGLLLTLVEELGLGWKHHAQVIEAEEPCAAWALRHAAEDLLRVGRMFARFLIPPPEALTGAALDAVVGHDPDRSEVAWLLSRIARGVDIEMPTPER